MKGKNSSYNVKAIEFIVNIFEILAKEATLLLVRTHTLTCQSQFAIIM